MTERTYNPPPIDSYEKNFLDALYRLKEGRPERKELKAKLKKRGTLEINVSTVAQEAGHSRTLIGMDKCKYPRVRRLIQMEQSGESAEPKTYSDLIKRLRASRNEEKLLKEQYMAEAAAHLLARKQAEANEQKAMVRLAKLTRELAARGKVTQLVTPTMLRGEDHPTARLILIRGLPGSGKSTMASGYQGYKHLEADQYFVNSDGVYEFDENALVQAHAWCLEQACQVLEQGGNIVVTNVFSASAELEPYTQLGYSWELMEATRMGKSIHNVPLKQVRIMRENWIPLEQIKKELGR